mmetsp:Transcript_40746/g.75429  ORF Transcript_40746/g.75429 Transcript_40746/m.75429 type:complete len:222 (-) Transcript_40746:150-815(-)
MSFQLGLKVIPHLQNNFHRCVLRGHTVQYLSHQEELCLTYCILNHDRGAIVTAAFLLKLTPHLVKGTKEVWREALKGCGAEKTRKYLAEKVVALTTYHLDAAGTVRFESSVRHIHNKLELALLSHQLCLILGLRDAESRLTSNAEEVNIEVSGPEGLDTVLNELFKVSSLEGMVQVQRQVPRRGRGEIAHAPTVGALLVETSERERRANDHGRCDGNLRQS